MGLLDRLMGRGPAPGSAHLDVEDEAPGIFLFNDVPEAIRAEKVLSRQGYEVKLVAPPAHLRAGCDLAVAIPRVEKPGAERALAEAGAHTEGWADSMDDECQIADLVTTEDFGRWLMVRAGNMKMTIEKESLVIVNTSGGGCPDIPYLNLEMVGRRLDQVARPKDLGYTLCGLMLDRAHAELMDIVGVRE